MTTACTARAPRAWRCSPSCGPAWRSRRRTAAGAGAAGPGPGRRVAAAARARGGARLRPARLDRGGRATGASTWPGSPGSRCARRCPARSPSPARSPAAASSSSTTATPVRPTSRSRRRRASARAVARAPRSAPSSWRARHCLPRACLHWGWLRGETYLDPLRLVGGGPVRLLPLWRRLPLRRLAPALPSPSAPCRRTCGLECCTGGRTPLVGRGPALP